MKRNSIRILGIDEKDNENPFLTSSEFFSNRLGIPCTLSDIDVAFRIGNTADKQSRPRVLLSTLSTSSKRNDIMRAKKFKLKRSNVTIYEDLTRDNFKLLQKAKKTFGGKNAWSTGGKIYVKQADGKVSLFSDGL
nr:unnamed protein product [Callosobruchus analis]